MHAIQMQLEASLKQAVAATLAKKCVIIYDRGVLDGASPVGERERSHALYATLEHLRVCVRAHAAPHCSYSTVSTRNSYVNKSGRTAMIVNQRTLRSEILIASGHDIP